MLGGIAGLGFWACASSAARTAAKPAADPLDDALVHGHVPVKQLDALLASVSTLPPERRRALAQLGSRANGEPIHVPDYEHEVAWVAAIPCDSGAGQLVARALASLNDGIVFGVAMPGNDVGWAIDFMKEPPLPIHPSAGHHDALLARISAAHDDGSMMNVLFDDSLDIVIYTCPSDATRREVVFDDRDDPTTQATRAPALVELGAYGGHNVIIAADRVVQIVHDADLGALGDRVTKHLNAAKPSQGSAATGGAAAPGAGHP
jgi:hypothetical protein